ncbi:MAG: HAD-IIIA family hydrolase, partial [Alphaproteobacteria bacterium]|nr:HAD-IIIA family hydrolase [Alphaproteobacteria bacterium]
LVFVVTNQAGIARGYYEEDHVRTLHDWMADRLREEGAHVDAFEYCPFHPEGIVERYRQVSDRRKPGPGMITKLMSEWPVDVGRSFLIGDRDTDLQAAAAAGIAGHRFSGGDLESVVRRLVPAKRRIAASD